MLGALPIEYREGEGLYICLEDPLNPQTVDDLRVATGYDIYLYVAADYEVRARITECYGGAEAAMGDLLAELDNMNVGSQDGAEEANAALNGINSSIANSYLTANADIINEAVDKVESTDNYLNSSWTLTPDVVADNEDIISKLKEIFDQYGATFRQFEDSNNHNVLYTLNVDASAYEAEEIINNIKNDESIKGDITDLEDMFS